MTAFPKVCLPTMITKDVRGGGGVRFLSELHFIVYSNN